MFFDWQFSEYKKSLWNVQLYTVEDNFILDLKSAVIDASSTQKSSQKPQNAIDPNVDKIFHSKVEDYPWLSFDIGEVKTILKIGMTMREKWIGRVIGLKVRNKFLDQFNDLCHFC